MVSSIYSRLAATGLALALWAAAAVGVPSVTGTTASGKPGEAVAPTLTIANAGDVVDTTRIAAWDFLLSWDATVLTLEVDKSTMQIGTTTYPLPELYDFLGKTVGGTVDLASSLFRWSDTKNFSTVDLSGDLVFTGWFRIDSSAQPGIYPIRVGEPAFPSSLIDDAFDEFTYYTDTTQQAMAPAMFVRVAPTQPAPEPGSLSLLAGVLGALYLLGRRRKLRE